VQADGHAVISAAVGPSVLPGRDFGSLATFPE
jgi:hypothetical protein